MKIAMGLLAFCCAVLSYAGAATAQTTSARSGRSPACRSTPRTGTAPSCFTGAYTWRPRAAPWTSTAGAGTSCGTRVLTVDEVAALHRALDNKKVQIQPLSQSGQGDTKCLVGFTMVPKKYLSLVIP